MSCADWLAKMQAAVGEDARVKRLGLVKIADKIKSTRATLDAHILQIGNWDFPVDFDSARTVYMNLLDAYKAALNDTWRHVDAVTQTYTSLMKSTAATKDAWRTERNKVRAKMIEKHVAPGPAKVVADVSYSMFQPPSKIGISLEYSSKELQVTEGMTVKDFGDPMIVRYSASKTYGEQNHYEQQWGSHYLEHKQCVTPLFGEVKAAMKEDTSTASSVTMDVKAHPDLNPTIAEQKLQWFSPVAVKPSILVRHCEMSDTSLQAYPYMKVPHWLMQYIGTSVVIVLPSDGLEKVGDPGMWIERCDSIELAKFPAFYMAEGDCLWVPAGCVPVAIGIPVTYKFSTTNPVVDLKSVKQNQTHFVGYGIYPIIDTAYMQSNVDKTVCADVAASWARASEYLPKSWKNAKQVKLWQQALLGTTVEGEGDAEKQTT